MSVAVRSVVTRPTVDVVWPFYVFFKIVGQHFYETEALGATQWFKGDPLNDLSVTIVVAWEDPAVFEANKAAFYAIYPAFKSAENAAEADWYVESNNITITTEEVNDPDLTGFVPLGDVPPPSWV